MGPDQKFNPKPRYQDLWATILFVLHLAAFIALAALSIPKGVQKNENNRDGERSDPSSDPLKRHQNNAIIVMVLSIVTALVLSFIYLLLVQRFAKIMIKVTLGLSVLFHIAVAVYFIVVLKSYIVGALSLLFALIYAFCAWSWRHRIPFATIMLQTVCGVTRKYGGTMAVAGGGLLLTVAWSVLFVLTLLGIVPLTGGASQKCHFEGNKQVCEVGSPNSSATYGLFVAALFSFYWTTQVIRNTVHTTISGVFGVFYFLTGTTQMPSGSVTLSSLKRACTTAFGSICFGSLIIAIVKLIRALLRTAMDNSDGVMAFVACIAVCILACIEDLLEYFTHYAFTQVAVYGKSFCTAAKDTWTMIKDRGVEAIINDNLIGNVLGIGSLLIGFLNAIIALAIIAAVKVEIINEGGLVLWLLLVAAFVIGLAMMSTAGGVIESGTATTFVCLAEDPMALARTQPELFERIRRTYPNVIQGV